MLTKIQQNWTTNLFFFNKRCIPSINSLELKRYTSSTSIPYGKRCLCTSVFFWGIFIASYLLKKKIKISLLIKVQNALWQMNNPRRRKFAYWTVCGVELAARPTQTSPYFFERFLTCKITLPFSMHWSLWSVDLGVIQVMHVIWSGCNCHRSYDLWFFYITSLYLLSLLHQFVNRT